MPVSNDELDPLDSEQIVLEEGQLLCRLTGEPKKETPEEETLQSLVEQLHQEYSVELEDMERAMRVPCVVVTGEGREKTRRRTVSLAIFEPGSTHEVANITHAAIVAKARSKPTATNLEVLAEVLSNLSEDREPVFGLWTNGADLKFQMRTYHPRSLTPEVTDLADFPARGETLEDLEDAERRPLRVATKESLLATFKRCHNYLYGNQSMRGDRAFWQLLYLIFCKIHDEKNSLRKFYVGAREANTQAGRLAIQERIEELFREVRTKAYADVFEGNERLELNDRAVAFIAGELGRYSLLATDTDAKGLAYEEITSTTLKRERGQFFTPRNAIRMMVDMVSPEDGKKVLDPACGSGGFLVVALAYLRREFLHGSGCAYPDHPVPRELKQVEAKTRYYARTGLFGVDVDPELRKAARMNMVMNNDGHCNIFCFNSLEYGVENRRTDDMAAFEAAGGGHGAFDYVFTNPPFGAKIPVEDSRVLESFDLGHVWARKGETWVQTRVQKKVAPEILFIEACYKYLKPGSGVMAVVVPNGILGNPGEQMAFVRWWMLDRMELLASVDLPAEAFLPQVSVQASCIFLRRRTEDERAFLQGGEPKQRPVFMAIAERCGHGRRGEPTWERNADGTERIVAQKVVDRFERRDGEVVTRERTKNDRVLADDLPWIAEQFRRFVSSETFEAEHGSCICRSSA